MSGPRDMRIVLLADVPETMPTLARWFVAEWEPYYGGNGPGDAEADLAQCCNRDRLPLAVVALNGDGGVLGTAALKSESVGSELGVGPWLAALLVGEAHRCRGVGSALVGAIEAEAHRLGFSEIFTSSDGATGLLERGGWRAFETARSLRGTVAVYRRPIAGEAADPEADRS